MKLNFVSDYLSIQSLNNIELIDFTIITGVNGSGKSHLLSAIEKKHIQIVDIINPRIVLFNYINFMLDQESQFSGISLSQEKDSAWQYYTSQAFNTNFTNWEKSNINEDNYEFLKDISKSCNKSIWNLTETEIGNPEVYSQLLKYKATVNNYINNNQEFKSDLQALSILKFIGSLNYGVRELTKEKFQKEYVQIPFKNDFLPQMIGKIFLDYAIQYDINRYNFMMAKYEPNLLSDELTPIDPVDYEQQNPKPWNILNEILDTYNNFDYIFTNPEKVIVNNRNVNWQVELQSKSNPDLKVTFENLSSGEKILLALALSMYKANSDKFFPDILLLDEIDASLHPSMIKNLFKVIENVFLKHNVKVILVTHSPTTIALADEESIFLMNKYGDNRLEKATKNNALSVLTEGFATLNESKVLFDNISDSTKKIILFTEGKTDIEHIKIAKEKLAINDLDFDIFTCDGADKLKQFLIGVPKALFKDKTIIGIFDYDQTGITCINKIGEKLEGEMHYKVKENENVHAIMLPIPDAKMKTFGYCPIEYYYSLEIIELQNIEKLSLVEANNILKNDGLNKADFETVKDLFYYKLNKTFDKVAFVEKVRYLDSYCFVNFKALFGKIEKIISETHS